MKRLSPDQYQDQFKGKKRKEALERAWKNRDFEIELYWKRATYFWAFTAATFTGYFVVLFNSAVHASLELVMAIMGFIFSSSWYMVNLGSKKWQENWEKHIDQLEDDITGPIYKTVLIKKAPSVSGVNLNVSLFVTIIWVYLIINFFLAEDSMTLPINLGILIPLCILGLFILSITGALKKLANLLVDKSGDYQFELRKKNYKNTQSLENESTPAKE
ncbi:MAG: hypothetical protein ACI9Z3_001011 [Roseivirga sp.]|jgi:hypothetical protein